MPGATAAITQTITKDPDATAQSSFSLFATSEGKQIDEVAYTINIVKTNLANAGDGGIIKSATLTMTVSPAWVAAHGGIDHIMVLRRAEDGTTQILVPQLTGTDAYGNYILTIFSPNGLSTFSVASVSSISTGPATSSGSSVSSGYSSGYSSSGTTSDSSDTSSFTSRSVTSSGAQAGQAASFTFAQAVSADKPVGIRIVSLVPTRTLGATDLIVQDAAIGTIAETLGRPVAGVEEITPVGISSSAIDHATITFAVSGSWLTAHNIAPSNIVLVHNTNGQWVDLPTTFSEQVGNTYYFTATTSGFSLFAVSVKKTAVASLAPAVPTISDPGIQSAASPVYAEAATALSVDNKPVAAQTTVAPVTVPESSPYFPLPTILIGVTGIVIVVIGIVIGKRWWIRRQNPGQFEDTKFLR
jgi:PGF-pre-PGF domain-containing protein